MQMNTLAIGNTTKGFTLVELVAVLVILGILATIVKNNMNLFSKSNFEKITDMANTNKALELYRFIN